MSDVPTVGYVHAQDSELRLKRLEEENEMLKETVRKIWEQMRGWEELKDPNGYNRMMFRVSTLVAKSQVFPVRKVE